MRRKTEQDYHNLANEKGFKWLGSEAKNSTEKTSWKCSNNHIWQSNYNRIQQNVGCPYCYGNVPKNSRDYHDLAERMEYKWLGPEVKNISRKTFWKCPNNHQWEAPYNAIQQGKGCLACSGKAQKVPEDYHRLAQLSGLIWLGPKVRNVETKTNWQCSQGHQWASSYHVIQRGHSCPICARNVAKTPEDYHALARIRGFRWLGSEVSNAQEKTIWQCQEGHQWGAPYTRIQQGIGCPFCATQRIAKTLSKKKDDYENLAKIKGVKWLGPEVFRNTTKTQWECQLGHQFWSTYTSVRSNGGCPHCYGNVRKTFEDYHTLADSKGFKWLGPEVTNTNTKTWWMCKREHKWEAIYNNIANGSGCPVCYQSKGEECIAKLLQKLSIKYERQQRFPECKMDGLLRFDFFIEWRDKRILIEYDGPQHAMPIPGWIDEEDFELIKRRDEIKNKFAKKNGFILIRVPYTKNKTELFVLAELSKYLVIDEPSMI